MADQSTILLRTHHVDEHVRVFVERLINESGHDVAVVSDERSGELELGAIRKISLTDASLASLGVAVPKDAARRCGDYSLALASRTLPAVKYFRMLEADVRLGWKNYRLFFNVYRGVEGDFLATNFRKSEPGWRWRAPCHSRMELTSTAASMRWCVFRRGLSDTFARAGSSRRLLHRRTWASGPTTRRSRRQSW